MPCKNSLRASVILSTALRAAEFRQAVGVRLIFHNQTFLETGLILANRDHIPELVLIS
jgi:hypothetical protein